MSLDLRRVQAWERKNRTSIYHFVYVLYLQHDVPPGKHALITVRQPKGNLVWIMAGSQNVAKNEKEKFKPRLQTWDECDFVQVCLISTQMLLLTGCKAQ